jgi:putative ABC transport system permease protein
MKQGRFYSSDYPSDSIDAIVVNEKAIKALGFKEAIGKQFYVLGKRYRIIGVIQDYHFIPKVFAIGAQAIFIQKKASGYALITVDPAFLGKSKNRKVISDYVKQTFERFNPVFPIDYKFLNDYKFKEAQFMDAIIILVYCFSLLALFIACIGLYGLSSFVTVQRIKEIGVRKANGATVMSISILLFKEYVKILSITILISWPVAYLITKGMLQSFAYKINISIWHFIVSTAFVSILVIAAVLIQSLQAAKRNPVEALKYE